MKKEIRLSSVSEKEGKRALDDGSPWGAHCCSCALRKKVKREKQREGKENALKKLAWGSLLVSRFLATVSWFPDKWRLLRMQVTFAFPIAPFVGSAAGPAYKVLLVAFRKPQARRCVELARDDCRTCVKLEFFLSGQTFN